VQRSRALFFSTFFQTQGSSASSRVLEHFKATKQLLNKAIYRDLLAEVFQGGQSVV
jgi:hypothetical protein